jgi:hypothetical protein
MKVIEQSTNKLVIDQQNTLSKIIFLLLIAVGFIMTVFYFISGLEPLLWIGLLILVSGLAGYPFLKSIRLSLDKEGQSILLAKASMIKKQNQQFRYSEIDNFKIEKVLSKTSGEYGDQINESFYLTLVRKDGKPENVFASNSSKKIQNKLDLIYNYFTKIIL